MKTSLLTSFVICLALTFAACGNSAKKSENKPPETSETSGTPPKKTEEDKPKESVVLTVEDSTHKMKTPIDKGSLWGDVILGLQGKIRLQAGISYERVVQGNPATPLEGILNTPVQEDSTLRVVNQPLDYTGPILLWALDSFKNKTAWPVAHNINDDEATNGLKIGIYNDGDPYDPMNPLSDGDNNLPQKMVILSFGPKPSDKHAYNRHNLLTWILAGKNTDILTNVVIGNPAGVIATLKQDPGNFSEIDAATGALTRSWYDKYMNP